MKALIKLYWKFCTTSHLKNELEWHKFCSENPCASGASQVKTSKLFVLGIRNELKVRR